MARTVSRGVWRGWSTASAAAGRQRRNRRFSAAAGADPLAQLAPLQLEPAAGAGRRQQLGPDEESAHQGGPKGQVRKDERRRVHVPAYRSARRGGLAPVE